MSKVTDEQVGILESAINIGVAARRLQRSEGQTKKMAKEALRQDRLSDIATRTWRGWLGLVDVPQKAVATTHRLGPAPKPRPGSVHVAEPDEPASDAALVPDEPLVAAGPAPTSVVAEGEAEMAGERRGRGGRPRGRAFHLLCTSPLSSTYEQMLALYLGDRTLANPRQSLYTFVHANKDKLPPHVVEAVIPRKIPKTEPESETPEAEPKGLLPVDVEELLRRVVAQAKRVEEGIGPHLEKIDHDMEMTRELLRLMWETLSTHERRSVTSRNRINRLVSQVTSLESGKEAERHAIQHVEGDLALKVLLEEAERTATMGKGWPNPVRRIWWALVGFWKGLMHDEEADSG